MLEALALQAEAEARWLDVCAARLTSPDAVVVLTLIVIRPPLRRATRVRPGTARRYQ